MSGWQSAAGIVLARAPPLARAWPTGAPRLFGLSAAADSAVASSVAEFSSSFC